MPRPLLVDPSSRGGIPAYTELVARSLQAAGASPEILGNVALEDGGGEVPVARLLPDTRWGPSTLPMPIAYSQRLWEWARSAVAIERHVRRTRPDVVHFQMPINRRLDARLLQRLTRRVPLVWTAHDVLPFETTPADRDRFAAIYRAVDRVIVHTPPAAALVRELAGVEAVVIDHPVSDRLLRLPREEARRRIGVPEGERLLVALGFVREYKGYGLLADVWEQLGVAAPRLLLMGELMAEQERPVLERLQRSGRADVRVGYAPEQELQTALLAADALLLPYVTASDSGLLHLARAAGVPVLASDAPQLAASVTAASAGAVLPRTVAAWSEAVTGELPPPPPTPPDLRATGEAHLAVYRDVEVARAGPLRLAVYSDATQVAGAEQSLATLLEGLAPQVDVTIVGVDAAVVAWLQERRPSARTALLPPVRDKRDVRAIAAHMRYFARTRPQILQVNLRHSYACQFALAAGLLVPGTRVIAVEHFPTEATDALQLRLKRLTSRGLAAHVAVSDSSARAVEAIVGLPRGRVRTIYNGVEERPDRADRAAAPVVGAVGRFVEEKGFDVFLEALAQTPGVSGVLVGDGPERARIERLRERLGLVDRVELTGWRTDSQALIGSFDALVVPSRVEPLGIVALEAMSAGVPVVASRVGGLQEVVADGETGVLVAPDDAAALAAAIGRVLDPAANRAMGERGRAVARSTFSRERMVRSFEDLYRSVVA
ncbi:glycosyltransferase [Conexibacter sp. CPCC 206217]|uniref:glycosyltransferase n=1 Tax=Conexibacter sp. CPCC 206217 TaxID=3064574 RepID=UPI00272756F4|nr:glycosyltransferase [Conexibacter sp. CPCC 206217]MDO8209846.1 glycosyltransferase [Conexibacter sp. CPCC 206217]